MFPKINAEVKTSLRWYRKAKLRNRNLVRCKDEVDCPYVVHIPSTQMIPFQLVAGIGDTYGQSNPTAWYVKDTAGNTVANLTALVGNIVVLPFANPNRDILMLEEPLTLPVNLPTDVAYEMEIVTAGGTYYSETFKAICPSEGEAIVQNPSFENGSTGWYYGNWPGELAGVVEFNIELPGDAQFGDVFLVTDDLNLYTWNGSGYDSELISEGIMYSAGVGEPWYYYDGVLRIAIEAQEPVLAGGMPCWQDIEPVSVFFDLGSELTGEELVRLYFRFVNIESGSLGIYIDGVLTYTVDDTSNNVLLPTDIILDTDAVIEFRPSAGFAGCLSSFSALYLGGGLNCFHKLTWRNCGDLGTVHYKGNAFENVLYLPANKYHDISAPSPRLGSETEDETDGNELQVFARKDVDWRLSMAPLPGWLLDALTEAQLCDTVTLQVAGEEDADTLEFFEVEHNASFECLTNATILFRVDDATVASGCCDSFDPACITSCTTVYGIEGTDELIEGNVYLREDAKEYATYLGFEAGPVDAEGFGTPTACASGLAQTEQVDRPYVYWTGDSWFTAANIDDIGSSDCENGIIHITGNIMSQYSGVLQWSEDGSTWTDVGQTFDSDAWGSEVEVEAPDESLFFRIRLTGTDGCTIAYSPAVASPCACEIFTFNTNVPGVCDSLPADVTVLFVPTSGADLPLMGIAIAADYRINGGSWITAPNIQVTGTYWSSNGAPYTTAGDELEFRVRIASQVQCDHSMETLICEA